MNTDSKMRPIDVLRSVPSGWCATGVVCSDPLLEEDVLQEAMLVDVRFDMLGSVVGVLFDLRTSIDFRALHNTGVLLFAGVHDLHWDASPADDGLYAPMVVGSTAVLGDDLVRCEISTLSSSTFPLSISAREAMFVVGSIDGLPDAQPDFVEEDRAGIDRGMQDWMSTMRIEGATVLGTIASSS